MRDHRKLRAFQLADSLAIAVYRATAKFPRDEQYGLANQMRRSATSVPCNIVEGCARSTQPDYVRFLDIAYGSACELAYQVSLAHRLGYLADTQFAALHAPAEETARVLGGLIKANRPRAKPTTPVRRKT